jgi:hypothetical protein
VDSSDPSPWGPQSRLTRRHPSHQKVALTLGRHQSTYRPPLAVALNTEASTSGPTGLMLADELSALSHQRFRGETNDAHQPEPTDDHW